MISNNYRWIVGGVGLGWLLGGPIGALLGGIIGSQIKSGPIGSKVGRGSGEGYKDYYDLEEKEIIISFLILCAEITKSDGFIAAEEIRVLKAFLIRNFGAGKATGLMKLYKQILEQKYDINGICAQIRQEMDERSKITIIHILYEIGKADGELLDVETKKIEELAHKIGLSHMEFASIRSIYIHKTDKDLFAVLELSEKASNEEVKSAYRAMIKKYHPDKVRHLSAELKTMSEEKFKHIQAAYEAIKEKRGMK